MTRHKQRRCQQHACTKSVTEIKVERVVVRSGRRGRASLSLIGGSAVTSRPGCSASTWGCASNSVHGSPYFDGSLRVPLSYLISAPPILRTWAGSASSGTSDSRQSWRTRPSVSAHRALGASQCDQLSAND